MDLVEFFAKFSVNTQLLTNAKKYRGSKWIAVLYNIFTIKRSISKP